jgi:hypothetical protein
MHRSALHDVHGLPEQSQLAARPQTATKPVNAHFRDAQLEQSSGHLPPPPTPLTATRTNSRSIRPSIVDQSHRPPQHQHTADSAITPDSAAEQLASETVQLPKLNHMASTSPKTARHADKCKLSIYARQPLRLMSATPIAATGPGQSGGRGGQTAIRPWRSRNEQRRRTKHWTSAQSPSGPPTCWTHELLPPPAAAAKQSRRTHRYRDLQAAYGRQRIPLHLVVDNPGR